LYKHIIILFIFICSIILTSSDVLPPTMENSQIEDYLSQPAFDQHFCNETHPEITIVISFAGDCTIGTDTSFPYLNSFPYQLEKQNNDYTYFFRKVKPVFDADDLTIVNLETTLTNATIPNNKRFRFKGDPSYVNILKAGNIEMVNISNNHIYDYKEQGFSETLETLRKAGIQYLGEGHIAFYCIKGISIASIGYTGWTASIKKDLAADINIAKNRAQLVIVSFHWGMERAFYPNDVQMELGRFCIDRGADIVVGHHPHVIQGIEKYKGKYIVYSLGNFCFGGNRNPSDKDCFIFQYHITFKDNQIVKDDGKIIPCSISSVSNKNDYQPTVLQSKEKQRVFNRIKTYSRKLKYGIKEINI